MRRASWRKRLLSLIQPIGLVVGEVGPWATEKHERLRKIHRRLRGARGPTILPPPQWRAGASYIELYSGRGPLARSETPPRSSTAARLSLTRPPSASGAHFSDLHFADARRRATATRLRNASKRWAARRRAMPGRPTSPSMRSLGAINRDGLHLAFLDPFRARPTAVCDHRENAAGSAAWI